MKKILPGDVELINISISSPKRDATISIKPFVRHIDIYEDMLAPTMMCNILIKDDINMISNLPIVGEELITINFSTPGFQTVEMNFSVFEVSDETVANDLTNKVYVLRCVSEESMVNAKTAIDFAVTGSVDDYVIQMLKTSIGTPKTIISEKCKGTDTYVFPRGLSPFQGIDFLRRKAVSLKYASSSFVFFENQRGFNFITVESLLNAGQNNQQVDGLRKYTYTDKSKLTNGEHRFFRNIINYTVESRTDTVHKLHSGAFKTVVNTFDVLTKQFDTKTYTIANQQFKSTDRFSKINGTSKYIKDAIDQEVPTNIIFMPKTADESSNFIHEAVGPRHIFSSLLGETTVTAHVYGDSSLCVGDVINCTLKTPEVFSVTDSKASKSKPRANERNISGNFLVTKLRHNISNRVNFHYTQSLSLVKIGANV